MFKPFWVLSLTLLLISVFSLAIFFWFLLLQIEFAVYFGFWTLFLVVLLSLTLEFLLWVSYLIVFLDNDETWLCKVPPYLVSFFSSSFSCLGAQSSLKGLCYRLSDFCLELLCWDYFSVRSVFVKVCWSASSTSWDLCFEQFCTGVFEFSLLEFLFITNKFSAK